MNADDKLPTEVIWQDDGHVTDVVVDSLADGQDSLVPQPARAHVQACEWCARRLGEAVLLSLQVQEHLTGAMVQAASPVLVGRPSWPMPVAAMVVALVTALLATLPVLLAAPARLAGAVTTLLRIAPDLVRAAFTVAQGSSGGVFSQLPFISMAAVVVLLVVGTAVARFAPRQQPARGGAR